MKRFLLVALVLLLVAGINAPENMVARLGVSQASLWSTIVVLVIAGLVAHLKMALIVLVAVLLAMANFPQLFPEVIRVNPDLAFAALIAVVFGPVIVKKLDLD